MIPLAKHYVQGPRRAKITYPRSSAGLGRSRLCGSRFWASLRGLGLASRQGVAAEISSNAMFKGRSMLAFP